MAITDIASALAQYNANLSWHSSPASAQAALEAVRFLLVNRIQRGGDSGATFDYASLETEKQSLEKFLGATMNRARGRSRRNGVAFQDGGIG